METLLSSFVYVCAVSPFKPLPTQAIFFIFFSHCRFVEAVSPEVLEMFREAAQALVEKMGAVDAVAASLAHISGTKEIKSRSLLNGREVVIT